MAVFDAVICKHFSVHVKKHCFLILHGMMLTHALWNETFLYSEVPSSFLVNTMQTLSKSVYNCQSYWQKFRGTFFMAHCVVINSILSTSESHFLWPLIQQQLNLKRLVLSVFHAANLLHIPVSHVDKNLFWNPITSPWMKQLTWFRIVHSGDWCLHLALNSASVACEKRRLLWQMENYFLRKLLPYTLEINCWGNKSNTSHEICCITGHCIVKVMHIK